MAAGTFNSKERRSESMSEHLSVDPVRCQMLHMPAKCGQILQFFDSVGETFDSYA